MKIAFPKFIVLLTGLCLGLAVNAAEIKKTVMFPHGKNSTIIQGSVVRGDRDVYLIRVRSGQIMTIQVSALENNAAFSLYESKSKKAISGTEEEKDSTKWSGTLSKTGEYRIAVGGTRGNARYKLQVSVK